MLDPLKDIQIGSGQAHVRLEGPRVESRHAVLSFENGRFYVTDHGTRVNGEAVVRATRVTEADRIEIGRGVAEAAIRKLPRLRVRAWILR